MHPATLELCKVSATGVYPHGSYTLNPKTLNIGLRRAVHKMPCVAAAKYSATDVYDGNVKLKQLKVGCCCIALQELSYTLQCSCQMCLMCLFWQQRTAEQRKHSRLSTTCHVTARDIPVTALLRGTFRRYPKASAVQMLMSLNSFMMDVCSIKSLRTSV